MLPASIHNHGTRLLANVLPKNRARLLHSIRTRRPLFVRSIQVQANQHQVTQKSPRDAPQLGHQDAHALNLDSLQKGTVTKNKVKINFKDHKGNLLKTVEADEGENILSVAHEYDIDLEGACEGSVACSTCHVILPQQYYDLLPEPSDDENDMLDMAFGLTDTSRLGCQVVLTKELEEMDIQLPSATRNMFVDGKKPTHH